MPLYEIATDGLVPFRQLRGGPELYEAEIERLLWANLDDLVGELLFPVCRQGSILGGGKPDIVELDKSGSVVVIEVKREVDRSQLAQCLEYAGWARTTNLDEVAGLYHRDVPRFWSEWQQFTGTTEPQRVTRSPRLILVARDFHQRTESALNFLRENGLPVTVIRIALYEDVNGRRFLDCEGIDEPELVYPAEVAIALPVPPNKVYQVSIADLIGSGLLAAGDELVWERPRLGQTYRCTVTADGRLALPDGSLASTPSGAAKSVTGLGAYDGWEAWRVPDRGNALLHDFRTQYLAMDQH